MSVIKKRSYQFNSEIQFSYDLFLFFFSNQRIADYLEGAGKGESSIILAHKVEFSKHLLLSILIVVTIELMYFTP